MNQPSLQTVKRLFAVSRNLCAFTGCNTPLVDPKSAKVTGRICHIKARSISGPRYDPSQSETERHGYENLILMCPIHHDIIDADSDTYSVETLLCMKFDQASLPPGQSYSELDINAIATGFLANFTELDHTSASIVSSLNQSGGQTAHSITNIQRQVVKQMQHEDGEVQLDVFSIDAAKCAYKEYRFDPERAFWPEDADPMTVCYLGGGGLKIYGKEFPNWEEANKYGDELMRTYNHYSFYKGAPHTLFLDRQDGAPSVNPANYPVFYTSLSNHKDRHVVLSSISAKVQHVEPLSAIGESHSLLPLTTYEVELSPSKGTHRSSAIPALKIEAGDAAACHVVLKPDVAEIGGYHWYITLRFEFGRDSVSTPMFAIVM